MNWLRVALVCPVCGLRSFCGAGAALALSGAAVANADLRAVGNGMKKKVGESDTKHGNLGRRNMAFWKMRCLLTRPA